MGVSKVIINGVTRVDLTQDTVASNNLLSGETATGADGEAVVGAIASKASTDLTVSGATVTAPAGFYSAAASKSVATTTHPNPTASINSSTGVVTASHTQTTGYVTGGTTTGTLNLTTQAAKTVTPTESQQTAVAAGRYTTGAVKVGAISSTYIGSDIAQNDSNDLTASGATVTAPAGYYAEAASKAVASGTAGTPSASKGTVSNHSVSVTPSVTNTTGYITGGTKTGTAVTVSASELVSGTKSITASGTTDVTNYASASVTSGTAGTPTATKGTVSNHAVTVTPSVTNTTGYITGGTKSGTAVTVSVAELESGTKSITENGTGISVSGYSTVDVDVPSDEPVIQSLTVTPTTSQQVFTAGEEIGDQVYSQISFQSSPVQTFSTPLTVNDTYHIVVHGSTDDGRTFKTTPVDTVFKCKTTELALNNVLTITNTGYTWTSHARSNYDALQVIINETTIVDGYSPVTVEACAPSVSVQPLSVTLNGTYTAPSGTAYSPVTVAVEGGGGGSVEEKQVNFVDYDGTILYSYTASEFANLSALPSNPGHAGLVSQGWNWTLAQIRSQLTAYPDAPVWVGQMYITQSGATEIDITLTAPDLHPYLMISPNGTVVIDWGDNTATDTVTGASNQTLKFMGHEYASAGNYTIKLTVSSGNFAFYTNSNSYRGVLSVKSDVTRSSLYANDITAIRIGENARIGINAFVYCSSLKSITIPNSDNVIVGGSAFQYCYALTSITVPPSVTSIGNNMFHHCYVLSSAAISPNVTSIGNYAFQYCHTLTSITIPSGVTSIGTYAFQSCYVLSSITIPSSVTSIGTYAFQYCYALPSITIPSGVTSIGNYTFHNCSALTSITIPSSVTSMGTNVFQSCYVLSSITIPSGITSIENYTFNNCYALTSITIPSGVTSIGTNVFHNCSALTSLTIPSGVTSIGTNAFNTCSEVQEFHFLPTTPPTLGSTNVFNTTSSTCVFYVPAASLEAYQTATNWSTYASRMVGE